MKPRTLLRRLTFLSALAVAATAPLTSPLTARESGNRYLLTLSSSEPRLLRVSAEIALVDSALTMDWASATFLRDGWATFVSDLVATGPDGAPIELEYQRPGRWRLATKVPSARLSYTRLSYTQLSYTQLSYTVRLEHDLISWEEGGHDESAYVLDRLLFFVGKAVFVTGGQREESLTREPFVVEFDVPEGYEVTTPWERLPGAGHRFLARGPRALLGAGILAGEQQRTVVRAGGLDVTLAVGTDFRAVLPLLRGIFEPLVPAAVELLDGPPGFDFLVLSNVAPRTEEISPYFSGGVLDRTVSFIAPGLPEPEMLPMLTYIVAHELLHLWNGSAVQASDQKRESWFSEGFTDYLAIRLLHALGALSDEQMLNGPQGFLDNYGRYLAVAGKISLRDAGLAKQANYDLVYSGGFVFALVLDLELRRHGRDFVGYMRELFRRYGRTGHEARRPSFAQLTGLASELAQVDLESLFQEFVAGTEVMALDGHLAHAGLRIRHANGKMAAIEPAEGYDKAPIAARMKFLEPVVATEQRLPR